MLADKQKTQAYIPQTRSFTVCALGFLPPLPVPFFATPLVDVAKATEAGGGSAAAKSLGVMKPLHPVVVPPVEPEPKEAKLVGPMVRPPHAAHSRCRPALCAYVRACVRECIFFSLSSMFHGSFSQFCAFSPCPPFLRCGLSSCLRIPCCFFL